ncbi:glycoside hydrolase family 16 protein [Candidatus Bathyarchaeota archaeon]|nr:glycoside hydrolase family 16 protein [Candidatus Bathyarchaeota archaeon]
MGLKNALVALLAASIATGVKADCECGYSTNIGNSKKSSLFTELLETDFSRTDDLTKNGEWMLPAFNVSKEQTHGSFGLTFRPGNVMALASKGPSSARSEAGKTDKTSHVKDAALELRVSSHLDQDMVSVAEIDSRGADLRYGSYRASMQLTDVPGTCAAFMWVSISSLEPSSPQQ